jgi:hypothetical protein
VSNAHSEETATGKQVGNTKHMTAQYRKNSLEARLEELLPHYPSYAVIAHELWGEDGGWSVNSSWYLSRSCNREEAISHLRHRWEVYKVNYHPKAKVKDLADMGDDQGSILDVDCIPFAEIRNANA